MVKKILKVLPLPSFVTTLWMRFEMQFEPEFADQEPTDEQVLQYGIKYLANDGALIQIDPVFYRDGWYYDRRLRMSWYEWRGTAWTERTEGALSKQFLYELSEHSARILEPDEIAAIKTLAIYGSVSKGQKELLYMHQQKIALRDIRRESFRMRLRLDEYEPEK